MPKLQENNGRYFITIPLGVVRNKNWKKGQELLLIITERNTLEIRENKKGQSEA